MAPAAGHLLEGESGPRRGAAAGDGHPCVVPEASYLMWMDCADVLPEGANAEEFFLEAGVALTGGVAFGGAAGTVRLNFGCRRETLDEGLERMAAALRSA